MKNAGGHGERGGDGRDRRGRARRDYTDFGFRELGRADPLDEYLDGDLSRDSAEFRAAFVKRDFRARLDEIEGIVGDLRRAPKGPDLTDFILDEVDARRPFVASRMRRMVTLGRLAAAAAVLMGIGTAVMIERARPGALQVREDPAPLSVVAGAAGLTPAAGRTNREEQPVLPQLARLALGPLARVESVEVRQVRDSWTAVAQAAEPARASVTWDRGLWGLQDRTIDGSAGLATFPVLSREQRAWFATVR